MNIPARCNGVYTRRGFILSYYNYSAVSTLPSAGFTNTDPRHRALDIPYISIRVIIAFERASPKPRRSSYLPANYCGAFASHMLLPSHIPIRIFRIDDFIYEKLHVNDEFTHCSNLHIAVLPVVKIIRTFRYYTLS